MERSRWRMYKATCFPTCVCNTRSPWHHTCYAMRSYCECSRDAVDPSGAVRNTDALLEAVKLDIRLRAEHDEAVRAASGAAKCKEQ